MLDESPTRRRACARLEQGCVYSALRTALRIVARSVTDLAREQEHDFANNDEIRLVESLDVLQTCVRNRNSTFIFARTQNTYKR